MQANIVRVNHSHLEFEKRVKNHPQVVTTSFGSHFALEIKTESTATYYGTLRNKLYDFFYRKRVILRPVGNIVYILPPCLPNSSCKKVYQVVEEALDVV
jgi:adenosylmethionine-8-amino-7-oxononanoate aminotransferase